MNPSQPSPDGDAHIGNPSGSDVTSRRDGVVLAVLAVALGCCLAVLSARSGMYADDAHFYKQFLQTDLLGKVQAFWSYIPGRNLHILWQHVAYAASIQTPGNFVGYHVLQSFFVALNAWLLGYLVIRLRVRLVIAILTVALFGLWPIYTEVYLWPTALPTHLISTTWVLCLMQCLLSSWKRPESWRSTLGVLAFYLLATFTYDQAAAASLVLVVSWLLATGLRARRNQTWQHVRPKVIVASGLIIVTTILYIYLVVVVRPMASGPVVVEGTAGRLASGFAGFVTSVGLSEGEPRIVNGMWLVAATYVLRALFVIAILMLAITLFSDRSNPAKALGRAQARRSLVLVGVALAAAIAGYGPSWAWAVSLRHTYFPILFVCLAYGLAFDGLVTSATERFRRAITVLTVTTMAATCVLAAFVLSDQVRVWNEREQLRRAVYERVANLVAKEPNGRDKCVKFMAVDVTDYGVPFYSEKMFSALNIYARDPLNATECGGEWIPDESSCADGFFPRTDPSVTYIAFPYNPDGSRNWLGATVALKCA